VLPACAGITCRKKEKKKEGRDREKEHATKGRKDMKTIVMMMMTVMVMMK
jgi:hypothetical protein